MLTVSPTTVAIVDGNNPVTGRALQVLLEGAGYEVRSLAQPVDGDLGELLEGVRLLLLPHTLGPEARDALVNSIADTRAGRSTDRGADVVRRRSCLRRRAGRLRALAGWHRSSGGAHRGRPEEGTPERRLTGRCTLRTTITRWARRDRPQPCRLTTMCLTNMHASRICCPA